MGKDSFIIYKSFFKPISKLSDKQLGRLFRAIFEYNISGVVSVEEDIEMAFEFFKNQFDIDESKYQGKVERNRENGRRGGNQKAENDKIREEKSKDSKCKQTVANASEYKRNLANLAYNENDNDNEKDLKEKELSNESPKKKGFDLSFVSPEYHKAFTEWLQYKKDRKETYKTQQSLQKCYTKLINLSGNNPSVAQEIVDQSIASNYAGLFELKKSNKPTATQQAPAGVQLGYGERIVDGRRTYGTGKSTIPMNAPPRPGDGYSWSAEANKWVY